MSLAKKLNMLEIFEELHDIFREFVMDQEIERIEKDHDDDDDDDDKEVVE